MEQQMLAIETGMAVYGGNGQIIGTVTETAGLGRTCIQPTTGSVDAPVTRARGRTGHLKVERPGGEILYVPVHGIEGVIPERGVYLTTGMLDELRRGDRTPARQADIAAQPRPGNRSLGQRPRWNFPRPRRWQVWRPRGWAGWRSEGRAAPAPAAAEAGES